MSGSLLVTFWLFQLGRIVCRSVRVSVCVCAVEGGLPVLSVSVSLVWLLLYVAGGACTRARLRAHCLGNRRGTEAAQEIEEE